jgi:phage tail-like protein
MALAARTDPLRNFKFLVNIVPQPGLREHAEHLGSIGFAEMSGLSVTNELIAYREGGMNTHPHKMVGQSDFPPVSFSRGVFAEQPQMWRWQTFMHSWQQGVPLGSKGLVETDGISDYRCDIIVIVYDHPYTRTGTSYLDTNVVSNVNINPGNVRLAFKLFNAWPGVFAMNGLNAGDNGILIQQMTLHHEGFYVAWEENEIKNIGTVK